MQKLRNAVVAYPLLAATIVVAVIGLTLLAAGQGEIARWIVGGYALLIAAYEAVQMVRSLMRGDFGLDILAVTAITAAVLVGEPWAALVVVLMLTGGEALEHYAENRSKRELVALLDKAPRTATRLLASSAAGTSSDAAGGAANDELEVVPVEQIAVGDTLLVRPGEVVPVDALLLDAAATFDESSLTGESLPVERVAGERINSGVVNGQNAILLTAQALAADSQYQQIVALVEQAQSSKAKTVRLADRYAMPFTVFSLLLAGLAWLISGDPTRFAEVLVVATPCPLLIAAPVAFLGGMSRAAKHGLIVKGGGTLEKLANIRAVAFDKTGTLTSGKPQLVRIELAAGQNENEILQLAASAEVFSSHVLASAIVDAAKDRDLSLLSVAEASEHATNGIAVTVADGSAVRVGKPAWVVDGGATRTQLEAGELGVYVARDGELQGVLVMRDTLRSEAAETLREFKEIGVKQMLIVTGDVAPTADAIAAELGVSEVYAECSPADKVRIISEVKTRPLMMCGDGLNDAPVLAAADVGFAMGARGATAASESADVVNRFDTIAGAAQAVRIGRDTVRIALESIWMGIALSVGLMLLAAFGHLPALAGAWLQELVDLAAILGALRAINPRSARRNVTAKNETASTRGTAKI